MTASQTPEKYIPESAIEALASSVFLDQSTDLDPTEQLELDISKVLHCGAVTLRARALQAWWLGELYQRFMGETEYSYTNLVKHALKTTSYKNLAKRLGIPPATVARACALRKSFTFEEMCRYNAIPKMIMVYAAQLPRIQRFCYINAYQRRVARGAAITLEEAHGEIRAIQNNMGYHVVRSAPLCLQLYRRLHTAEMTLTIAKDLYNNYGEELDDYDREGARRRLLMIEKSLADLRSLLGV